MPTRPPGQLSSAASDTTATRDMGRDAAHKHNRGKTERKKTCRCQGCGLGQYGTIEDLANTQEHVTDRYGELFSGRNASVPRQEPLSTSGTAKITATTGYDEDYYLIALGQYES